MKRKLQETELNILKRLDNSIFAVSALNVASVEQKRQEVPLLGVSRVKQAVGMFLAPDKVEQYLCCGYFWNGSLLGQAASMSLML